MTSGAGVEPADALAHSLEKGDGWDVCLEVSATKAAALGRTGGRLATCWDAVTHRLRRYEAAFVERTRSRVVTLDVRRSSAIAGVRDRDGSSYRVRFVRNANAWTVAIAPAA